MVQFHCLTQIDSVLLHMWSLRPFRERGGNPAKGTLRPLRWLRGQTHAPASELLRSLKAPVLLGSKLVQEAEFRSALEIMSDVDQHGRRSWIFNSSGKF
jgi:hypothetical protein